MRQIFLTWQKISFGGTNQTKTHSDKYVEWQKSLIKKTNITVSDRFCPVKYNFIYLKK